MRRSVGWARSLAVAAVAAAMASSAFGQVRPGSDRGLGLTGADIPPLLKKVQANPYRAPAEPACESIPREILALDQVLGPDVDAAGPQRSRVRELASGAVRRLIPYRGWVRFLTQANEKDKKLQKAATAGYARRGFLRGLEANMQCAAQAPEAVPASAVVADNGQGGEAIAARMLADRGPEPEDAPPVAPSAAASDGAGPALPAPADLRVDMPPQPVRTEVSDPGR